MITKFDVEFIEAVIYCDNIIKYLFGHIKLIQNISITTFLL